MDIEDAGHTWSETLSMFRLNISVPATRAIYKKRGRVQAAGGGVRGPVGDAPAKFLF